MIESLSFKKIMSIKYNIESGVTSYSASIELIIG